MTTPFSLGTAQRLADVTRRMADLIAAESDGLDAREGAAADELLVSSLDIATELLFQKGDPWAPALSEWELPWRKFGGDNPTTTYLSAPVSPRHVYRLEGSIADAVYVGVQVYTKGPGYNAPSANISDTDLVRDGRATLIVGGERPADGTPWVPLAPADYMVMVRAYHREPSTAPPFTITRVDDADAETLSTGDRLESMVDFFEEAVRSTLSVTATLRAAGANGFPPPDAPVHRPEYTGALFPTLDNVYDGFWLDVPDGHVLRLSGTLPEARYTSLVFYDRWFCTPDYRRVRCYLTGEEVSLLDDGTYEVYIGPEDPGRPNWIDTDGLRQGIFAIRTLLPTRRSLPTAAIVAIDDLG